MYNILIWGTGSEYDKYINLIKFYEKQNQFRVIGVTSNNCYYSKLDEYPFINKSNILTATYDWIIICATNDKTKEIRNEAISLNISEDILLSAYILQLPNFNFEKYVNLVKSKVTIFANNCWGGLMYKRLGLKVRSPFYNMFEFDKEYVKFLSDAKNILLNQKLSFIEMNYDGIQKINYPVYNLGGMQIYMNHYPDREQAEMKWYERIERINWENLFVMMYSNDLQCIKAFSQLPYRKKICFTSLNVDIPSSYIIPLDTIAPGKKLWEIINGSASGTYKLYDHIELLETGCFNNNRAYYK